MPARPTPKSKSDQCMFVSLYAVLILHPEIKHAFVPSMGRSHRSTSHGTRFELVLRALRNNEISWKLVWSSWAQQDIRLCSE